MDKNNLDLTQIKNKLDAKLRNVNVHDVIDNGDGSVSLVISGDEGRMDKALSLFNKGPTSFRSLPEIDKEDVYKFRMSRMEKASTIRRDPLGGDYLDLTKKPSVLTAKPQELYKRAMEYYKSQDVYGSSIDLMTNFASKGLRNDIDDPNIRNFYDNWVVDTGFDVIVDQIFFEFFRSGFVRTYKIVSKYEPKINYVSPIPGQKIKKVNEDVASDFMKQHKERAARLEEDRAAKKYRWSKDSLPIKYTILNPTQIEVEKSSLLMDQQIIMLKAEALKGVKELLETSSSDLTDYQKIILKGLPSEFKKAAIDGADLQLNPYLVGAVDYRRQPYEPYPFPRGIRAFESMEYKRVLREADYSTLDGITNFVLAITIGNDEFPIKGQEQLEAVSELFNTPSKAFNVVWDHTLKIQRIEPSDVGDILGQKKYEQVNDDITGAFGVIRALIDGVGSPSKPAADLAIKALREEIYYARKQVSRWIYAEYRDVAEAMGFDRYPRVRFDNMVLKDEILMMNVIQGMIDRRIISYRTGHEMLGFDFETMLAEMEFESPLVQDGTLGVLGSPYQQSSGDNVQETQRTPKGTPSEGRPPGKPAKKPAPPSKTNKPKSDKTSPADEASLEDLMQEMSIEELIKITQVARSTTLKKIADESEER
ncbi:MAG: hypothetical protein KAS32_02930 [Candidatus Peribacteraceae bacterium]|nr:hypothetical protein [Candidatus Peribacteraceae bacterium]